MKIFISGTDTNVGKTLISSWITLHTGFAYFKPIQTGTKEGRDSNEVRNLSHTKIYPEFYSYPEPLSPHLAAELQNDSINIEKIFLPQEKHLVVEGAGGVLVPINKKHLMIDLIKKLGIPVIVVSRTGLGSINHTLLTLEVFKLHDVEVLGVIMNGEPNSENNKAIEFYGHTPILAEFPKLEEVSCNTLKKVALSEKLTQILKDKE